MNEYEEYDLTDRDKPLLGLKMSFEYNEDYLIIIRKIDGIVLCVYSLVPEHVGNIAFAQNLGERTTNTFRNVHELDTFFRDYKNPYSNFFS